MGAIDREIGSDRSGRGGAGYSPAVLQALELFRMLIEAMDESERRLSRGQASPVS